MHFITQLALQRQRLTLLSMISLLIIGVMLYHGFPKRESPEITIRTSVVSVEFPGMTPERMEQLIALPVERKIREIAEVDEINTLITSGRMIIKVDLKDQLSNLEPVWQELRDKMEEVERELPSGSLGPFVDTSFGNVTVASIAITAEGFSYRDMELTAQSLQRKLYSVDGVSKAALYGVQEERVWLEVDQDRLAAIGGQLQPLIDDMQRQNVLLPAGTLNAEGTSLLLEASGNFGSVEDIKSMLIKLAGQDEFMQVKDLLTVRRGLVSPQEKPVYFNGQPAVVVAVEMQSRYDIEKLGREISALVKREEQSLPIGYQLSFATFQPAQVETAVDTASSNVAQTFAIVLLIMMVFLGIRSSLVIASIVVFSIMFALVGMSLLGLSLEQVSIAAIIISLGLLVDNGIVVVEDIQMRMASGESRQQAAMAAGKQFSVPLLVSTMTTIFAFVPFFLLEGGDGDFAFSLGAVVAVTLVGSWFSAVYFLPYLAMRLLKMPADGTSVKGENFWLLKPYKYLLQRSQRASGWVIVLSYLLVIVAAVAMSQIRQEMFPLTDRNQILIYVDMPKGSHITMTTDTVQQVSAWLGDDSQNPEVVSEISYIGSGGPRFYLSLNPLDPAPEIAFMLVNTEDFSGALALADRARRYLAEFHPEARFKIKQLAMGTGESGIVDIEISGNDLDRLLSLGGEVETIFRQMPELIQNENDWGNKIIKVLIDIDQDKARRAGISSESMAQLLSAFFDGLTISEYHEDDQLIPIVLRAAEKNRSSADDLVNMVLDGNDQIVLLEQVSKIAPQVEYSQIRRKNQLRTIIVSAKSASLTAGEMLNIIQPQLQQLDLSGGYKLKVGGEIAESAETNAKLARGLPAAFFLMLLVIVFQFNSFRKTTIVFMTIPLIFIGIPLGLFVAGEPVSFFGTLGIISLAGIIINNSIVLIDQIDIETTNASIDEGIMIAAHKRIRPILLTSATTVIGLIPLYLFGGDLWSPLAVVMMSGLALGSIITLFFVPACYKLMYSA